MCGWHKPAEKSEQSMTFAKYGSENKVQSSEVQGKKKQVNIWYD